MRSAHRQSYSTNAKLRMVRAAEVSGNMLRWAEESRIPISNIMRWKAMRDAGRLQPELAPGRQSRMPPRLPAVSDPDLQLKILRKLVRKAMANGFDPVAALGLSGP